MNPLSSRYCLLRADVSAVEHPSDLPSRVPGGLVLGATAPPDATVAPDPMLARSSQGTPPPPASSSTSARQAAAAGEVLPPRKRDPSQQGRAKLVEPAGAWRAPASTLRRRLAAAAPRTMTRSRETTEPVVAAPSPSSLRASPAPPPALKPSAAEAPADGRDAGRRIATGSLAHAGADASACLDTARKTSSGSAERGRRPISDAVQQNRFVRSSRHQVEKHAILCPRGPHESREGLNSPNGSSQLNRVSPRPLRAAFVLAYGGMASVAGALRRTAPSTHGRHQDDPASVLAGSALPGDVPRRARIASKIEHANVARILDVGEDQGELPIVVGWVVATHSRRSRRRAAAKRKSPPVSRFASVPTRPRAYMPLQQRTATAQRSGSCIATRLPAEHPRRQQRRDRRHRLRRAKARDHASHQGRRAQPLLQGKIYMAPERRLRQVRRSPRRRLGHRRHALRCSRAIHTDGMNEVATLHGSSVTAAEDADLRSPRRSRAVVVEALGYERIGGDASRERSS